MENETTDMSEKKILELNKGVDTKLVQKHRQLEEQLEKLGVDLKPQYRLSPPLGASNPLLYNS